MSCARFGHVFNRYDYSFLTWQWSRMVCFWCGRRKKLK